MQRVVSKFYLFTILNQALLFIPISVLFYQRRGLSASEIILLESLFNLVTLLFAIPTGVLADMIGRRLVLALGTLGQGIACLIIYLAHDLSVFAIAQIVFGASIAAVMDIDSAYLYDALVVEKQEDHFTSIIGKVYGLGLVSAALGSILGGILTTWDLGLPFLLNAMLYLFAAIVMLTLPDLRAEMAAEKRVSVLTFIRRTTTVLIEHRDLSYIILFSATLLGFFQLNIWTNQFYLVMAKVPPAYFGIIFALLSLFSAALASQSKYFEQRFGGASSLLIPPLISGVAYLGMAFFISGWGIFFLFAQQFARGICSPLLQTYANREVPSEIRATVLSVRGFLATLLFTFFGPLVGVLIDRSFSLAFIILACVIAISGVAFYLVYSRKSLRSKPVADKSALSKSL